MSIGVISNFSMSLLSSKSHLPAQQHSPAASRTATISNAWPYTGQLANSALSPEDVCEVVLGEWGGDVVRVVVGADDGSVEGAPEGRGDNSQTTKD